MRRGCTGCFGWRGLLVALLLLALALFAVNRILTNALTVAPDDIYGSGELPALPADFTLAGRELAAQGSFPKTRLDGSGPLVLMLLDPNGFCDPHAAVWMATLATLRVPSGVRMLSVMSSPSMPALLRAPAYAMLEPQRAELPIPVCLDFGRELANSLALPKGRVGIVLVNPNGSVARRYVGACTLERIEFVRAFLGAEPLPLPPRAPKSDALDAALAPVDRSALAAIAIVFLGKRVEEREIPHYGGSPLAMLFRGISAPTDPSLRLMTFLADARGGEHAIEIIAGDLDGYTGRRWIRVRDDAALRQSFGIAANEAAIVVLDAERNVLVDGRGPLPMWRLAEAGSVLGYRPPFDVTPAEKTAAPVDPAADRGR